MTLSPAALWWIAAGLTVAAELATGSFYLLMIALGLAAGALATHAGGSETLQWVAAALVGCGATGALSWWRARRPAPPPARSDHDVNLDIGAAVNVTRWDPDRTARVRYRGSVWAARLAPGVAVHPGPHRVSAVEGNWLVLEPA